MQLFQNLVLIASCAIPALAITWGPGPILPRANLTYDTRFDDPSVSLQTTACSTGEYGLYSKYPTFGDIPNFPNITGTQLIGGYDDPECGSCYEITYFRESGDVITTYLTAVNSAPNGFTISLSTEETITGKPRNELGGETVFYRGVDASKCGL